MFSFIATHSPHIATDGAEMVLRLHCPREGFTAELSESCGKSVAILPQREQKSVEFCQTNFCWNLVANASFWGSEKPSFRYVPCTFLATFSKTQKRLYRHALLLVLLSTQKGGVLVKRLVAPTAFSALREGVPESLLNSYDSSCRDRTNMTARDMTGFYTFFLCLRLEISKFLHVLERLPC